MLGNAIVEGARSSYPSLIDVYRFNRVSLTHGNLRPLMDDRISNRMVCVCGPDSMNSAVSDLLFSLGSAWTRNFRVLSGERFN
jgi:NAD(P)H-flavin reductase